MAMYEERCLHSDVCKYGKNRANGMYCTGERCLHFIDRTKWADGVKTNADRIRAMSDEELAKWLLLFVRSCGAVNGNNIEWADGMEEKMLDMLQQPAEGGA